MHAVVMEATSAVGILAADILVVAILAADISEDGTSEASAADISVDVTSAGSAAGISEDVTSAADISGAVILVAGTSVVDTSEAAILVIEALAGATISADRISRVGIVASDTTASRTGTFTATGILRATGAHWPQRAG